MDRSVRVADAEARRADARYCMHCLPQGRNADCGKREQQATMPGIGERDAGRRDGYHVLYEVFTMTFNAIARADCLR